MSDHARELHRLELIDAAISRREVMPRTGHYRSAVDDELERRFERVLPRNDQVARDATMLVLFFVRQLFASNSPTWKGHEGTTAADSDIAIESVFADKSRPSDLSRPMVVIRPGPRSSQDISVGNIKHHDVFETGSKTISYVDIGTMQILVHANLPSLAQDLVDFIHKALKMPDCPLLVRGFIKIENVSSAGYDQNNPTYNRSSEKGTHAVLPLTFTYYWQTTQRSTPREGQYEMAESVVAFLNLREGPLEEPFVDGRRDSVVESDGTRLLLPLDPDQD